MGMVLGLVSIDDESISKVLADPPLIWKVIAPEDPEMYEEERGAKASRSWFSKLFSKGDASDEDAADIGLPVEDIELDKAWHGIHYLMNKTASDGEPPLHFLVAGGSEVGNVEVGYGTARAFETDSVKAINLKLADLTNEELTANYNGAEMKKLDIYPDIWDDETTGLEYCTEYFDDLKAFIGRTAEADLGIIVYLS